MTETKGLSGVEFSFASRDFAKAESYRNKFSGVKAYGSYEEALADDDNDAVYIFSPHDLHLGHAEMAATAGKHVLVEKPIARTIEEAQARGLVPGDCNGDNSDGAYRSQMNQNRKGFMKENLVSNANCEINHATMNQSVK